MLLVPAVAARTTLKDEAAALEPGKPVERELSGGEVHACQFTLRAGQYAKVEAEQRRINIVLAAFDAGGKKIVESDMFSIGETEFIAIVSETAATYRLEVRAPDKSAPQGSYQIKLGEVRDATPEDRSFAEAVRLTAEGVQLGQQMTAEAWRKTLEKFQQAVTLFHAARNLVWEATTLYMTSSVYSSLGDKQKALEFAERALPVAQDEQGASYAPGTYRCVVSVKNLSGAVSRKAASLVVAADGAASLQPAETTQADGPLTILREGEAAATTSVASTSKEGEITRGRGALSFRVGDFYSGNDSEQMRLTEDGNLGIGTARPQARLDVNGVIRAQGGIQFGNGALLNVSPEGALSVTAPGGKSGSLSTMTGSTSAALTATGTQNRIAKWTDGSGTLGDSTIFEDANGNIGIGTFAPTSLLDLSRTQNAGTTFNIDNGFTTAGNGAYSGFFFKQGGANRFFFGSINDGNAVQTGGPGAVQLWNYTQGPTLFGTGNTERLRISAAGNVGIGTTNPQSKLDVAGDIRLTGAGSGLVFPDGTVLKSATTNGVPSGTVIISAINDPATTGVISDARLSNNVARLNGPNTFAGDVVVNGYLGAGQTISAPSGSFNAGDLTVDSNTLTVNSSSKRVGVGVPVPTEKLSVAGVVQSTTGGFKFPDGSVQATAVGKTYTNFPWNADVELSPPYASASSVLQLDLPAGTYLITASIQLENRAGFFAQNNTRLIECQMPQEALWFFRLGGANSAMDQLPVTIHTILTQQSAGRVKVYCSALDGGTDRSYVYARARRLTAIKIGDVVTQP